jgi:serine/threonine protein kinase
MSSHGVLCTVEVSGFVDGLDRVSNRHSDEWALGIILVQLVTGHFPWKTPHSFDPYWAYFVTHRHTFFIDVFPLSRDANTLFCGLLAPDSRDRLSLAEARDMIARIDTWYMTSVELERTSMGIRDFDNMRSHLARRAEGMLFTPPRSP